MNFEQLVGYGCLLLSAVAFLGCVYSIFHTQRWLTSALRTQGEVVSIRQSAFETNRTTYQCYYATVTFQPMEGQPITFESSVGRGGHVHFVGKRSAVLYLPTKPNKARIGEFADIWMSTLASGFMSLILLLVGLVWSAMS